MKCLKIIQILAKVVRVLLLIAFIVCIIGAAGCILGLIIVPLMKDVVLYDNKTLTDIFWENDIAMGQVYAGLVGGLISCGMGIFLSKYNEIFFKEEIKIGTPFDMVIVKKMRKVSIVNIACSLATAIVVAIAMAIVLAVNGIKNSKFDINVFSTVGFGLTLLILSLFCEYGARKDEEKEEPKQIEEPKSE